MQKIGMHLFAVCQNYCGPAAIQIENEIWMYAILTVQRTPHVTEIYNF